MVEFAMDIRLADGEPFSVNVTMSDEDYEKRKPAGKPIESKSIVFFYSDMTVEDQLNLHFSRKRLQPWVRT